MAFRTPVLVLHTRGRQSGRARSTTLAFKRMDDGSLMVVGGAGGQARLPDWVANLRAEPEAAVTIDRARIEVHAVELTGAEREETWLKLRSVWPRIETYERRAGRTVPVLKLIPVAESPPPR